MKKALKIILGIILLTLILLVTLPFIFKDKIIATVKEKINENVNAKVEFGEFDLSFIKNFPNASVELSDLSVINFKPFKGDTLFYSKKIKFKTSIMDAINGNLKIKYFALNDSKVNILVNEEGKSNYDIAKVSEEEKPKVTSDDEVSKLVIDSYEINNMNINYFDRKGKMFVQLNDLTHTGSGDFSADKTKLITNTTTNLKFVMDKTSLVDSLHLDLKATLDLDLKNQKFSFLENEAHINKLPLIFSGFVKLNDKNQEVELDFKTPSSDFKNFLALVPKAYAKDTEKVKTTGKFEIIGKVNGIVDEKHIPKFDINITSNNASFKFPELPKGVNNINLDTSIKNTTGLMDDMEVNINKIAFSIDNNTFNGASRITRLTTNPLISAKLNGKLNLADIKKVYPLESDMKLSGLIAANLKTDFDLEAVQKSIPERIKNIGKISVNDFEFTSKDMIKPLLISNAEVDFQPKVISLTNFEAKTGSSDIKATGTIEDLLGFVLSDKKLKGKFLLSSNVFSLADFMQPDTGEAKPEASKTKSETPAKKVESGELKIPEFLDISTSVTAGKVLYDNLTLENVKGTMLIKDQKATLSNLSANMFQGTIVLNGTVDTKPQTPVFDMKMGIKEFDIASSFMSIEMLRKIAPIAEVVSGKFNTDIVLNGKLTKDLTPDLMTIGGDALSQLLNTKIKPEKSKMMSLIGDKLKFINLKDLNLKNLKANLSFSDGKVNLKPMDLMYKDVKIKAAGSHGFDQKMDYKLNFNIPAKYLGSQVAGLFSKGDKSSQNMLIPVGVDLSGNFENPKIKTDMKSALTKLTSQLIEQQKGKLKKQAVDELSKRIKNKELKSAVDAVLKKRGRKEIKKVVKKKVKKRAKKEIGKALGKYFK